MAGLPEVQTMHRAQADLVVSRQGLAERGAQAADNLARRF